MSLLSLIITLVVVALILGLINWVASQYPTILDAKIIKILNIAIVIIVAIWLIGVLLGGWGGIGSIRVGR
jgi:hypothetical protein